MSKKKENYGPGGFSDQYDNTRTRSLDRNQHPGGNGAPFEDEYDPGAMHFFAPHGEAWKRKYRQHSPPHDEDLSRGETGTYWNQSTPHMDNFARSELRPDLHPEVERHYIGRGPKGWKRTDEMLKEEVSLALTRSLEVDPSELEVEVKDHCVYLKGTLPTKGMRLVAEDLVGSVPGVEDVFTQIRIKKASP
jgi:hypothetical protein